MAEILEAIRIIAEEGGEMKNAENKIKEKSLIIAKHLMMIHHSPEGTRTVPHWAGEINGHLKNLYKNSSKIAHQRVLSSLLSSDITSPYTYAAMHKKICDEKTGVNFEPPSEEGHRKVLNDIHRFASELSQGKIPKTFEENS